MSGGEGRPILRPIVVILHEMLQRLEVDPLWAREYDDFVRQVSFAPQGEAIDFARALAACRRCTAGITSG